MRLQVVCIDNVGRSDLELGGVYTILRSDAELCVYWLKGINDKVSWTRFEIM